MKNYIVVESSPIFGVWREKDEPLELKPAQAQYYLQHGFIKEVEQTDTADKKTAKKSTATNAKD